MKGANPTSRDIADLAGVSQATVSRALRNSPLVRKETRDRIQEIARELNYFVNRNAAGLRTHQSNTLALLLYHRGQLGDALDAQTRSVDMYSKYGTPPEGVAGRLEHYKAQVAAMEQEEPQAR